MLYAIRNADGRITALTESADIPGAERIDAQSQEVLDFLSINDKNFSPEGFLTESDIGAVRIIEDIIQVLIDKNLITFTDLPQQSQKKLLGRKLARQLIRGEEEEESSLDHGQVTRLLIEEDQQIF